MKVVFDTNIILDALIAGRPCARDAQRLIMEAAKENLTGLITANSAADIYYIARKYLGDADTRQALRNLLTVFEVASVGKDECFGALELPMRDIEDALLTDCAVNIKADYIVSRDAEFIAAQTPIPVITPEDAMKLLP